MAQVKLLKIVSGLPEEMDTAADDITLNSYTVQGGGPVLSGTGLDMNNQDVVDVNDLAFNNPASGTINQTAGALIIDNIMAKERENLMTTAGGVVFPVITDNAGQVDSFRLPALAGAPTASPTNGGEGHMVWDSTNNRLYIWDGSAWDDQSSVTSAENLDRSWTAEVNIAIRDALFISSANNVSPAQADQLPDGIVVGFALAAASAAASVQVRHEGVVPGFTGLTAGSRYYLDAATAGTITATPPNTAGNIVFQVGLAKSTTELFIQKQYIAKKA